MRAGNVIGGGDFSPHRILPDCVRAAIAGTSVEVRNPHAVRPYQHVLDPLYTYLMVAQAQYEDAVYSDYYNVGPNESDAVTTGALVDLFCAAWGEGLSWHSGNSHVRLSIFLKRKRRNALMRLLGMLRSFIMR